MGDRSLACPPPGRACCSITAIRGEQAEQAATALNERLGAATAIHCLCWRSSIRSRPDHCRLRPSFTGTLCARRLPAAPRAVRTLAATEQQELLAAIGLRDMEEILTRLHWREKATTADGARRMTTLEARSGR
jgi:hypothetical protein